MPQLMLTVEILICLLICYFKIFSYLSQAVNTYSLFLMALTCYSMIFTTDVGHFQGSV